MTPDQQELFTSAPAAPAPRPKRTSAVTCKRRYLSGGEWQTCGHAKDEHFPVGHCFVIRNDAGEPLRTIVCRKSCCSLCGCPEFQAREHRNPFLAENATKRKPTSLTMCANPECRHAKRDHHRTGCSGMSPWNGQTAACNCRKFVNPFAEPRQTEPELFPPAAEEVRIIEQ